MPEVQRPFPSIFLAPPIQFLIGLLLFIALLHRDRDLTILTLLILGIGWGARLWARMSFLRLHTDLTVDRKKVFPGERLSAQVQAQNRKFLPIWLKIELPISDGLASSEGKGNLSQEIPLLWYQRAELKWDLTARRRGAHRIGPISMATSDLFGFFPKERPNSAMGEVLVYPRIFPMRPIPFPRKDLFGLPGERSPVKDPIFILGTRDYQNGQPSKHIHWKASARHQRLQEKVFEPSEQEKVLMALDVDPFIAHGAEEDFEATLEAMASLAVYLDRRGIAVGLVANASLSGGGLALLPIARNHQQLPAILEGLARLEIQRQGNLLDLLSPALTLTWGVSCFHFSYGEPETIEKAGAYFRERQIPALFLVSRPEPKALKKAQMKIYRILPIDAIGLQKDPKG